MKVLYCGSGWADIVRLIRERLPNGVSLETWDRSAPLADAVRDKNILLPSNAPLSRDVVFAPKELVLVQQPAVGVDGIDLAAARERGVPVCNAPQTNTASVAEAALLLILALARRWKGAMRAFEAAAIGEPIGTELFRKTLLVVGLGQSGSHLARVAEALGIRAIGARSSTSRRELLAMCAEADIVSVHCPLTSATRGLIGEEVLGAMKPGALLVNCARGPIVDREALVRALDSGRLGGVGLDVYWEEPWEPRDPLFERENVITLPHIGGSTDEAFGKIADIVARNIRNVLDGTPLVHRVG